MIDKDYLETIKKRSKESRVYQKFQLTGLMLADILNDDKHKSLYIKLAKERPESELITLARDVAERRGIKNKGAYFMFLLSDNKNMNSKLKTENSKPQPTKLKTKQKVKNPKS